MHRLFGVVLPDNKRIDYALTLVHGIGWSRSKTILEQAKVKADKRVQEVSDDEIKSIMKTIEGVYRVEGDLREEKNENIKKLKEQGTYRGLRHTRGLPVRGQRTRSNARTKRGGKKTVSSHSKEAWAKIESQEVKPKK
ncbi:30S ribosomal protein S13 [Candidatus Woesebacteria bacterium]|nr:30S ribosomal protein S13 [Candidatus Woesebacteria bacterium]